MSERRSKRSGYTVGVSTVMEVPDMMAICPHCGGEVGLWSQEIETRCVFCDREILNVAATNN